MENLVDLHQLQSYYNNKRVFVTGHTGFKGAWLLAWLHILGARIKGYALAPEYRNGLFDLLLPSQIFEHVVADIRDKDRLLKEIDTFQPDYIFHLAAQPLVRRSYEIPAETFEVNVVGTANLLEAVTHLKGNCAVVTITTDKVYENKEQDVLYREEDILGGYDPYSTSKACTELVINSFRNSFFNASRQHIHNKALASVRAGNVIGGGDWSTDRIIPDIVRSLIEGQTIQIRNPFAVRPWQHVLEPLAGYLCLGALLKEQPLNFSKAYNFGPLPEDHITVGQLVETAINVWGNGSWKDISDPGQLHEAALLKLDIGRAMRELHWKPKLKVKQAVEWTLQWYKQPQNALAEYSFQQIKNYISL
jgi:CDP-glucose 4,6-dehydratase